MAMHRGFPQTFREVIHGQKTGCFENKNHIVKVLVIKCTGDSHYSLNVRSPMIAGSK